MLPEGNKEKFDMRSYARTLAALAAMFTFTTAGQALAADVTDVLDAADEVYLGTEKVKDPIDISLTPKFSQRYEWSKLKREYSNPQTRSVHLYNELEYKRVVNEFDIGLEVGLFHDFSFRMNVPIIISDVQSYKFDTSSSNAANHISDMGTEIPDDSPGAQPGDMLITGISTLAPADARLNGDYDRTYQFFSLTANETLNGTKRAGLGDLSFGLAWSPYNTERHFIPERPWEHNTGRSTVTLAFDYKAPTGKVMGIDNAYVGSGVHELLFTVAASHRFSFVDPYIRLQYGLPIAIDKYYPQYNNNQTRVGPGMWGRIDLGIEFIPYESIDVKFQRAVKIDLRGFFKYTAEGRAYSELSDALGTSDCVKTGDANGKCGWVASKWSNAGIDHLNEVPKGYQGSFKEDGLFDYEGFAKVGAALNLTIQPIQYVAIVAGVAADYTQNHFITFTKAGKDRVTVDNEGNITDNSHKDTIISEHLLEERNPTFSHALDSVGNRVKRTEQIDLEWFVGLRLMY